MSNLHEIEGAIRNLQAEELVALRAWFTEYDAELWDRRIERDVAEGRLDALPEEALLDAPEGRCTDLSTAAVKDEAKRLVERLPEDATWEDIQYQIYVRRAIEAGVKDSREGRTVPLEEARQRVRRVAKS